MTSHLSLALYSCAKLCLCSCENCLIMTQFWSLASSAFALFSPIWLALSAAGTGLWNKDQDEIFLFSSHTHTICLANFHSAFSQSNGRLSQGAEREFSSNAIQPTRWQRKKWKVFVSVVSVPVGQACPAPSPRRANVSLRSYMCLTFVTEPALKITFSYCPSLLHVNRTNHSHSIAHTNTENIFIYTPRLQQYVYKYTTVV